MRLEAWIFLSTISYRGNSIVHWFIKSHIQRIRNHACKIHKYPVWTEGLSFKSASQNCVGSKFNQYQICLSLFQQLNHPGQVLLLNCRQQQQHSSLSGALLLSAVAVIRILISSPLLYTNNSSPPLYTNNSRRVALKTGLAHFSDPVPRPLEKKYFCVVDGFWKENTLHQKFFPACNIQSLVMTSAHKDCSIETGLPLLSSWNLVPAETSYTGRRFTDSHKCSHLLMLCWQLYIYPCY